MRKVFLDSFFKAVFVVVIFVVVRLFYSLEIVRENVEDIGFDIVNKLAIEKVEQNTTSPKLMLFGFDDLYMEKEKLLDSDGITNYGYLFPRDRIARFIDDLDMLCEDIDPKNNPKALFIDYDFSYTSMPYGKNLAKEDKVFLEILKKKRPYVILLPKTQLNNFILQSKDKDIQYLIKTKKIIFVSVSFLTSKDGITRRYLAYKNFKSKVYPNVDIALWQLSKNNKIDSDFIVKQFKQKDIIANRIFLKSYKSEYETYIDQNRTTLGCKVSQSYWDNYTMYSAYCSLFDDIVEEDLSNAVIMLGGTYSKNKDEFKILDIGWSRAIKGIELHANTLMSMYKIDGQIKPLNFYITIFLVFFIFFILNIAIELIFQFFDIENKSLEFLVLFIATTFIIGGISLYLLLFYNIWFNWFVPIVIYQLVDMVPDINFKKES